MDYVASATNNLGFVETVEKLMGITKQIPRRAQLMRVMLSELQRISSHLLWLATHAIDIGAMTPFFYCFREREQVLDLFESYCGARRRSTACASAACPTISRPAGSTTSIGSSASSTRRSTSTSRCSPTIASGSAA